MIVSPEWTWAGWAAIGCFLALVIPILAFLWPVEGPPKLRDPLGDPTWDLPAPPEDWKWM